MMTFYKLCIFSILFISISTYSPFDESHEDLNRNENSQVLDTIPLTRIDTIVTFNENNCTELTAIYEVFLNDMIETVDTISTMDMDTYEEKIQIMVNQSPKSVLLSEKEMPLDCIEQIDTLTDFNMDTYEETITIRKRYVPKPKK